VKESTPAVCAPSRRDQWRWRVRSGLASMLSSNSGPRLAALARRSDRPLIVGYHRVVDDFAAAARTEMPSMLISRSMFERHLECIGSHFTFVSLDEIGEQVLSGRPFARPVAAVTFDDGYRDVYEQAVPVMTRKGIPGAMFVVTEVVGRPASQIHDRLYSLMSRAYAMWKDPRRELVGLLSGLGVAATDLLPPAATRGPMPAVTAMLPGLSQETVGRLMETLEATVGCGHSSIAQTLDWDELRAMRRAGFIIGSHTRTHVSLPMEGPDTMATELAESKHDIESHMGGEVRHFAYPGGHFTPAVVDALDRAGYRFGYTACPHGDQRYPALTLERLLLWEGSSLDAGGRFSPAILSCQVHDLWPPAKRCGRVHAA